jgi:tetratricopeptide (TPR) repeat protein
VRWSSIGSIAATFRAVLQHFVSRLLRSLKGIHRVRSTSNSFQPFQELVMAKKYIFKVSRRLAIAAAALALVGSVWAVPQAQFQPAFEQFMQAAQGRDGAIEKSADAFSTLLKIEPSNPVLMAYAGAATSMKATTTWLPWKKMHYAEDGMAMLDKALAMLTAAHNAPLQHDTPAVLEVRFVAANTFLAVPGFMNRSARGAKLLNEVLSSPLLAASPLPFRGDVWMAGAALAAREKRIDDARKLLNDVIQANAPQVEAARAQLKALTS